MVRWTASCHLRPVNKSNVDVASSRHAITTPQVSYACGAVIEAGVQNLNRPVRIFGQLEARSSSHPPATTVRSSWVLFFRSSILLLCQNSLSLHSFPPPTRFPIQYHVKPPGRPPDLASATLSSFNRTVRLRETLLLRRAVEALAYNGEIPVVRFLWRLVGHLGGRKV